MTARLTVTGVGFTSAITFACRITLCTMLAAASAAALAATKDRSGGASADPAHLEAAELATRLADGRLSAVTVTEAFLARIDALDDAGPLLNAVIEVNPEARSIAADLDARRAAGERLGPLHGVPVLLKANIDTGDRMATQAGSLALAGHRAPDDAFLVTRLRAAGAVVLGKTNLSEWANFRANRSSSGWSSAGGQTRNPYVLDRNPCGSSSGSAVAVAAALAPLAVGTETDGSIVCPSSLNGIVGIKPTVGTVSRHGIIPISHTQDTAGPMARTVTDAALLLTTLVARDPADPGSTGHPAAGALLPDPAGLRLDGQRIGVNRNYYGAGTDPRIEAVYQAALARLERLGAALVDELDFELPAELAEAEMEVLLHEFKAGLNAYLASHPVAEDRDTLAELIAWNEANAERVMPIFGQDLFVAAEARGGLDATVYLDALAAGPERMRRLLEDLLARYQLDLLVTPAGSFAWKTDWLAGDRFQVGSSSLAAMSGFPSITLPAGTISGLPVGIALVGARFSEPDLIQAAYAFEQAGAPIPGPTYLPSLETGPAGTESAP